VAISRDCTRTINHSDPWTFAAFSALPIEFPNAIFQKLFRRLDLGAGIRSSVDMISWLMIESSRRHSIACVWISEFYVGGLPTPSLPFVAGCGIHAKLDRIAAPRVGAYACHGEPLTAGVLVVSDIRSETTLILWLGVADTRSQVAGVLWSALSPSTEAYWYPRISSSNGNAAYFMDPQHPCSLASHYFTHRA